MRQTHTTLARCPWDACEAPAMSSALSPPRPTARVWLWHQSEEKQAKTDRDSTESSRSSVLACQACWSHVNKANPSHTPSRTSNPSPPPLSPRHIGMTDHQRGPNRADNFICFPFAPRLSDSGVIQDFLWRRHISTVTDPVWSHQQQGGVSPE